MPDLNIETVGFCASYYGIFLVASSTGSGHYTVTLNGGEGPAYCTCPAFKYSKSEPPECKHIGQVWKQACLWNPQWRDEIGRSVKVSPAEIHYSPEGIPGESCPNCGGPTVPVRIAV